MRARMNQAAAREEKVSFLPDRIQSLERLHERVILAAQNLFNAGLDGRIFQQAVRVTALHGRDSRRQGPAPGLGSLSRRGKAKRESDQQKQCCFFHSSSSPT